MLNLLQNDCSVRVSNELGAGNPKSAAFSVLVVTMFSFIISVTLAIIILCLRDHISYIFTEGETVAKAVSELSPLLAITLVLNGIQPVLSGEHLQSQCDSFCFKHYRSCWTVWIIHFQSHDINEWKGFSYLVYKDRNKRICTMHMSQLAHKSSNMTYLFKHFCKKKKSNLNESKFSTSDQ